MSDSNLKTKSGAGIVVRCMRWLMVGWSLRRIVKILFAMALMVGLFYAVVNLHGYFAWQSCKKEMEARGENLEWAANIPAPVPDDLNFANNSLFDELLKGKWADHSEFKKQDDWKNDQELTYPVPQPLSIYFGGKKYDTGTPEFGNWRKAERIRLTEWYAYYVNRGLIVMPDETLRSTHFVPTDSLDSSSLPTSFVKAQVNEAATNILDLLSCFDPELEILRKAASRPLSRYPIDYSGWIIHLPHLEKLESCCSLLALRALTELALHDSKSAMDDVMLAMRILESLDSDTSDTSQLVRIKLWDSTLQPIWEGLIDHQWSDQQLQLLIEKYQKINYLEDYCVAVRADRVLWLHRLEVLRKQRKLRPYSPWMAEDCVSPWLNYQNAIAYRQVIDNIAYLFWPSGWLYQNKIICARFTTYYELPCVDQTQRLVKPDAVMVSERAFQEQFGHATLWNYFTRSMMWNISSALLPKFARAQSSVDLAMVACALERFWLANGRYPDNLDVLVPQFLPALPHDIMNGQPLRYKTLMPEQWMLYSVGWNQKDEGGTVSTNKLRYSMEAIKEGDWVWKYPTVRAKAP